MYMKVFFASCIPNSSAVRGGREGGREGGKEGGREEMEERRARETRGGGRES